MIEDRALIKRLESFIAARVVCPMAVLSAAEYLRLQRDVLQPRPAPGRRMRRRMWMRFPIRNGCAPPLLGGILLGDIDVNTSRVEVATWQQKNRMSVLA